MNCEWESCCRRQVPSVTAPPQKEQGTPSCRCITRTEDTSVSGQGKSCTDVPKRPLSVQVMEYCRKYSQNSNLGRYLSVPESGVPSDAVNYWQKRYEATERAGTSRQDIYAIVTTEERPRSDASVSRERRRWARPPLIGESSTSEGRIAGQAYIVGTDVVAKPESRSPSPNCGRAPNDSFLLQEEAITEETSADGIQETVGTSKDAELKPTSPTSSVTSHKPLEWDSGADVGYYNEQAPRTTAEDDKLSTIERMALARGCSAALRLDPEGTNESARIPTTTQAGAVPLVFPIHGVTRPDANSTPTVPDNFVEHGSAGDSESEIEITPIVKNHLTGIITGCPKNQSDEFLQRELWADAERDERIEISDGVVIVNSESSARMSPRETGSLKKNAADGSTSVRNSKIEKLTQHPSQPSQLDSLKNKRASSMDLLAFPLSKLTLKRSQSELNVRARDNKTHQTVQPPLPLIFDSTSSIATIVNKPTTVDKLVQTSFDAFPRESVGIQVSVPVTSDDIDGHSNNKTDNYYNSTVQVEERKETSSSVETSSLRSILKNASNTYNVRGRSEKESLGADETGRLNRREEFDEHHDVIQRNHEKIEKTQDAEDEETPVSEKEEDDDRRPDESVANSTSETTSSGGRRECGATCSDRSRDQPLSVQSDMPAEDGTVGRASNSFEYFPGHVYENVQEGSTSRVSSIDTAGKDSQCSTIPNTSSSLDEKLWGDSDSLVRDLQRSVNILKSLVDANKCDRQVKKRLIHHVIKRLVTAKYTDDRIEHDLEENVPWNPADARNKVYRNEIIQALASKRTARYTRNTRNKHTSSTTDTSLDDWKPRKRNVARIVSSSTPNKTMTTSKVTSRLIEEMMDLVASSANTDTPTSPKFPFDRHTDTTLMDGRKARMGLRSEDRRRGNDTDPDKSQTSESPTARSHAGIFYAPAIPVPVIAGATVSAVMTNASVDVAASATATTASTSSSSGKTTSRGNETPRGTVQMNRVNEPDWRVPTTMSERRIELGRCTSVKSSDAKLIDYAEMEKENQLVWITNEISHLCHLKKLLQDPKNFKGRRRDGGSSSPRKRLAAGLPPVMDRWPRDGSESWSRSDKESEERGNTRPRRNQLPGTTVETQWSSHGNLQIMRKPDNDRDTKTAAHIRKRNSCTQTASDGTVSGHSRTGGQVVTVAGTEASIKKNVAMCDASVQTVSFVPQDGATTVKTGEEGSSSSCRAACGRSDSKVDGAVCRIRQHVCYCKRYASHARCDCCIVDSGKGFDHGHANSCTQRSCLRNDPDHGSRTNAEPIRHPTKHVVDATAMNVRKEAKNKLNATCKSQHTICEVPVKMTMGCVRCCSTRVEKVPQKPSHPSNSKDCQSNDTRVCTCDCIHGDMSKGNRKMQEDRDDIPADSRGTTVTESDEHATHRSPDNSPRTATDVEYSRCTCIFDEKPERSRNDQRVNTIPSAHTKCFESNVAPTNFRSCRTCGTSWPVRKNEVPYRKCKCSQDYLKPVAYELKFDEISTEKRRKGLIRDESLKIHKLNNQDLPTVRAKSRSAVARCASPNSITDEKNETGEIEENNENDEKVDNADPAEEQANRVDTLKDFLAVNKPEFLENVETRRRYMAEISHLRSLKREKRKQLLAMADTTGFLKPQRSARNIQASSQRKLSEYEMKLRLRMRYQRLNEVRNKRREREKEQEVRRNHLMAKLFGKKLQQKVLKGQVDLSQSVSVISNL